MTMSALVLEEGDTVEIIGKRSTAARAVAPYKEDEGLDILRIDGLQRANAGVGSGDFVTIRKTDSRPAQRVVFAPAQQNLRLRSEEHTSELQSLMRISYAVFCLKKKTGASPARPALQDEYNDTRHMTRLPR